MNLLNRIEGYCIKGENHGIVNELAKATHSVLRARADFGKEASAPSSPWFGIADIDPEAFGAALARVFERSVIAAPHGTRVAGFKEVRYSPRDVSEAEYDLMIDFLAKYFVGSRFIFNTRNWEEVANSGWWRNYWSKYTVKRIVEVSNQRFSRSIERLGDRSFLIDYSDYKNNPTGFDDLLDWLGESVSGDVIQEVMSEKLSHADRVFRPRSTKDRMKRFVRKFQ